MICEHPKIITNPYTHERLFVPCGHCLACSIRYQNKIATRIKNECLEHKFNIFFTLTYDNSHIPYVKLNDNKIYRGLSSPEVIDTFEGDLIENCIPNILVKRNGRSYPLYIDRFGVIYYKDIQNFFKKIRNAIQLKFQPSVLEESDYKLRYVICGEYGGATFRNHYHGIFHTNNEKLAKWLLKAICTFWQMCDWEAIRLANEDALPSFVESCHGADYVAKYTTKFDTQFPLSQHHDFRPFVKYSKRPYYGLSTFDKKIIRQIVDGSDIQFTKTIIDKSGKPFVIRPSSYLSDFLFGKSPKYLYDFDSSMVQYVIGDSRDAERKIRNFVERIRKHVLEFFGSVTSSVVTYFIDRLKAFRDGLKALSLKEEMKLFEKLTPLQYAKLKYQTYSPFYVDKDKADVFRYMNIDILEQYYRIDGKEYNLAKIYDMLHQLGVSLYELVELILQPPNLSFRSDLYRTIDKHKSYLSTKLL